MILRLVMRMVDPTLPRYGSDFMTLQLEWLHEADSPLLPLLSFSPCYKAGGIRRSGTGFHECFNFPNTLFASSNVSFDPTSYQSPGTFHV
jgi:hypothetical protein